MNACVHQTWVSLCGQTVSCYLLPSEPPRDKINKRKYLLMANSSLVLLSQPEKPHVSMRRRGLFLFFNTISVLNARVKREVRTDKPVLQRSDLEKRLVARAAEQFCRRMEACLVLGLLLLVALIGASQGLDSRCDGRADGAQCFGSLGGAVNIQLMNNISATIRYSLKKNETIIFVVRNGTADNRQSRYCFDNHTGTLRITNLTWTDDDIFQLERTDASGLGLGQQTLRLSVLAPLSGVKLASWCQSMGETTVSCVAENRFSLRRSGKLHYVWTLDGKNLTEKELLSKNDKSNNLTLRQNVAGELVCSVRNEIENLSKTIRISTCGYIFLNCTSSNGTLIQQWAPEINNTLCVRPTTETSKEAATTAGERGVKNVVTLYSVGAVLAVLAIAMLVIAVVVFASFKKRGAKKRAGDSCPARENDEELDYANVSVAQRRRTSEMMVEYCQVVVSACPATNVKPSGDDCVYAQISRRN